MKRTASGFELTSALMLVAVIAVIGLVGYTLWQRSANTAVTDTTTQSAVDAAPTIKNKEDLDTALRALDDTDIAGTAATDIDAESNF